MFIYVYISENRSPKLFVNVKEIQVLFMFYKKNCLA